jgi:hypothetical protein
MQEGEVFWIARDPGGEGAERLVCGLFNNLMTLSL